MIRSRSGPSSDAIRYAKLGETGCVSGREPLQGVPSATGSDVNESDM